MITDQHIQRFYTENNNLASFIDPVIQSTVFYYHIKINIEAIVDDTYFANDICIVKPENQISFYSITRNQWMEILPETKIEFFEITRTKVEFDQYETLTKIC